MVAGGVIGRRTELAAVDDFLGAGGGFGVLALQGEPGIGKTTIWAEGVRRARALGARVLVARPAETETRLLYTGLADLFGAIGNDVRARLPEPQKVALEAALLQAPVPARGIDEAALFAAVLSLLGVLADERQVVVGVDDLQWLDRPTVRALSFAARRLEHERIRFLVTVRSGAAALPPFVRATDDRTQVVEIGAPTLAALHEIIKQHTGRALPRPTLVQVAKVCAGNPFYALEIAAGLDDEVPRAGRMPVPASVTGIVEARLERLPASTRRALLVAAALSQPTVELVDRAAIERAEDEGIVSIDRGRIRFVHSLFASAVYEHADTSTRRRLHRRLAAQVPDPEERARHLALSSARPDEEIASAIAVAGGLAAARGAPDAAARLVELALDATPARCVAARDARLVLAAGYWFDAGDLGRGAGDDRSDAARDDEQADGGAGPAAPRPDPRSPELVRRSVRVCAPGAGVGG